MALKGAAVYGIQNLFIVYYLNGYSPEILFMNVTLPTIFFNLFGSYTNGYGATQSAVALEQAIDATDDYLSANPRASLYAVKQQFITNINNEMLELGGTASTIPSFPINNPVPYIVDLANNGNCN